MKKIDKKEIFLLVGIFCFFCLLLFFVPITGDDWYNYIIGKDGFISSIQNAITMYFTWEGRFVSRIFINLFTCHRIIYIFLTSFLITSFCYFTANFIKTKHKYFLYFITLLFLLTLENTMWTQSFLWVAGSITYLFPTILFIGYLYYYFHVIRVCSHLRWYHYVFSSMFSIIITMFVENIAVCYIVFHFVVFLYQYLKSKKVDFYLLINGFSALLGLSLMLFSPGSAARMLTDASKFQKLSLFSKIKFNVPNFVHYTFLCNIPFLFLLLITFLLFISKCFQKKIRFLLSFFTTFIFLFFLVSLFLHQSSISNTLWDLLFLHLYILVFFLFLFLIFFVILLFKSVSREKAITFILTLFISVSSNLAMLVSPVWGGRVALLTIVFFFFSLLYFIIDFMRENKISVPKIVFPINIILVCFFALSSLINYYKVYQFYHFREEKIQEQLNSKQDIITIYVLPNNLLWGINPLDEFHIKYFRKYYHISEEIPFLYYDYTF